MSSLTLAARYGYWSDTVAKERGYDKWVDMGGSVVNVTHTRSEGEGGKGVGKGARKGESKAWKEETCVGLLCCPVSTLVQIHLPPFRFETCTTAFHDAWRRIRIIRILQDILIRLSDPVLQQLVDRNFLSFLIRAISIDINVIKLVPWTSY